MLHLFRCARANFALALALLASLLVSGVRLFAHRPLLCSITFAIKLLTFDVATFFWTSPESVFALAAGLIGAYPLTLWTLWRPGRPGLVLATARTIASHSRVTGLLYFWLAFMPKDYARFAYAVMAVLKLLWNHDHNTPGEKPPAGPMPALLPAEDKATGGAPSPPADMAAAGGEESGNPTLPRP